MTAYRCVVCKALPVGSVELLLDGWGMSYCTGCKTRQFFRREQSGPALARHQMDAAALNAAQGVDSGWIAAATAEARRLAATGAPFTIDTITNKVGLPIHRNATGHLLPSLARQGLLVKVGFTQGTRESQHGRAIAVWRGREEVAA